MSGRAPNALSVMQVLLAKYHADVVLPLAMKVAELQADAAQLRRQAERGHCGTWRANGVYYRGDEVMHNGSTFRALVDEPPTKPPAPEWQLVARGVK